MNMLWTLKAMLAVLSCALVPAVVSGGVAIAPGVCTFGWAWETVSSLPPPEKQPEKRIDPAPSPTSPQKKPAGDAATKTAVTTKADDTKAAPAKTLTTADEVLAALETADAELRTLTADITFDNIASDIEGGDRQVRRGRMSFRHQIITEAPGAPPATSAPAKGSEPAPKTGAGTPAAGQPVEVLATAPKSSSSKSFAVTFDTKVAGGKLTKEARTFVLSGGVLVEKLELDQRINRYKLGADAAKIDPLKIGEGPFPIPFGQKPADIKARFAVELLPGLTDVTTTDASAIKRFEGSYQLRLVPRAGTKAAKEFTEARIWFGNTDLIPIMARTVKVGGGSDEFRLINIQRNKPIEDSVFSTATPEGWTVEEKEMH